jgi:hypothetical protein
MKSVHGVNEVPNPSYVHVESITPVGITTTPGVTALTAGAIKGGDVPKKIEFTTVLIFTRSETIIFTLFKDGVAQGQLRTHDAGGAFTQTVSMHWVDPAPGKGEPVYHVTAFGSVGGATTLASRALTVTNQ